MFLERLDECGIDAAQHQLGLRDLLGVDGSVVQHGGQDDPQAKRRGATDHRHAGIVLPGIDHSGARQHQPSHERQRNGEAPQQPVFLVSIAQRSDHPGLGLLGEARLLEFLLFLAGSRGSAAHAHRRQVAKLGFMAIEAKFGHGTSRDGRCFGRMPAGQLLQAIDAVGQLGLLDDHDGKAVLDGKLEAALLTD
jgi:hypothetical protein